VHSPPDAKVPVPAVMLEPEPAEPEDPGAPGGDADPVLDDEATETVVELPEPAMMLAVVPVPF